MTDRYQSTIPLDTHGVSIVSVLARAAMAGVPVFSATVTYDDGALTIIGDRVEPVAKPLGDMTIPELVMEMESNDQQFQVDALTRAASQARFQAAMAEATARGPKAQAEFYLELWLRRLGSLLDETA